MMEGPCADSEEKREPVGDIDTAVVDSLKALDPNLPIREADMPAAGNCRERPISDIAETKFLRCKMAVG